MSSNKGEKSRYRLVWRECGVGSELAERFYVPGFEGYLPFFIWGEDLERLAAGQSVTLNEEQLLKGILYGMYEAVVDRYKWHRQEDRSTHLYLLDVLGNGFKYASPEKMILDVAYDVRLTNGCIPGYAILKSGVSLMPKSSRIRSDLILDIWDMLSENGIDRQLLEETVSLVRDLDMSELLRYAREVVSYYGFCALLLLDRSTEMEKYLEEYVHAYVRDPQLTERIRAYQERGISAPSECRVPTS